MLIMSFGCLRFLRESCLLYAFLLGYLPSIFSGLFLQNLLTFICRTAYTEKIQSVLFDGIKKGVFSTAKFDSHPELLLARILETDTDVLNWLRPAPQEFNITYNHGHNYEPDFVVETEGVIYLVEVKGEDKLNDPDVIAKKKRGGQYCEVASRWGKANGYKEWRYLFIPSKQVMPNSSFMQLARQFDAK